MFKISKSLGFLAALSGMSALIGCAPERADPEVMNIQFHNQLRSDCQKLNLKISTINPDQIKAISRCLNSHGDLGPIHDYIQATDLETLTQISSWINQEILSNPKRMSDLEQVFNELSKRKILDDQLIALGEILKDPKAIDAIVNYFKIPSRTEPLLGRDSLLTLTEIGTRLFSSPKLFELRPLLADLIESNDTELLFVHQKNLANLFSKTHDAISISDHNPYLELLSRFHPTVSGPQSNDLRKVLAQLGSLMRSGKLKSILSIVSKLIVFKEFAPIEFHDPSPLITQAERTQPIDFSKNDIAPLFRIIQGNTKIIDATLRSFSHFVGREEDFSNWLMTHTDDILDIEELVVQADIHFALIQNPAIKYMSQLGQSERNEKSKTIEQTYNDIVLETNQYKKLFNFPVLKWATPNSLKNRMNESSGLLPSIGNNLHSIGIEFFRDLFFELDRVSTKRHNGLLSVTAFAHARLLTVIAHSIRSLPKDSEQVTHILRFITRNALNPDLNHLLNAATKVNPFSEPIAVQNSAYLLSLAGELDIPELDAWILSTLSAITERSEERMSGAFIKLISHPLVTESLQN